MFLHPILFYRGQLWGQEGKEKYYEKTFCIGVTMLGGRRLVLR